MIERLSGDAAIGRSGDIALILEAAFASPDQRWSADSVGGTLAVPGVVAFVAADGCALLRLLADEAEILTIAVLPGARGRGLAARLLAGCLAEAAAACVALVHLEVAEANAAARALYARAGFIETGRRKHYYRAAGRREDAVLMARSLVPAPPHPAS